MFTRSIICGGLIVLALGVALDAAVVRVPADYPTVQAAVNVTNTGDTIIVSPGNHGGAQLFFPRFPAIQGTNPQDPAVVAATRIAGIEYLGQFSPEYIHRLSGVTVAGVEIHSGGSNDHFQFSNCSFEFGLTGVDLTFAGAIRLEVLSCTFFGNDVGLLTSTSASAPVVHVRDSSFEYNLIGIEGRVREVRGCRFEDNFDAAGILLARWNDPNGLTFTRNHVSGTTGLAVQCLHTGSGFSPPVIRVNNNYIVRNQVGLSVAEGATVDSNTIALNDQMGLQISGDPATVPIRNTILYGNGVDVDGLAVGFNISYCCLTQFFAGPGNVAFDPLFEEPAALDFHLASGSPCINRGNPAYDWSIATVDSDNDQRVRGNRIDIGADETPVIGPSLVVGDLNGDGVINGLDVQTFVDMLLQ